MSTTPSADRLPPSTYRLQLHQGFTLDDARALVPYLAALGVTHCYCSPVFRAMPGSTHGYDVCRHTEINPELGGEAALEALSAELAARGMRLLLDFVPNHMSNDPQTNEWWRDVLENGPSSPYARYFDIDWDPVKPELHDRLLLPILGEPYGVALERGALALRFEAGGLVLTYGPLAIPINPRRSPMVFEWGLDRLEAALGLEHPEVRELLSVLTALRNLPPYTERDPRQIAERQREKEVARERLARLFELSPAIRHHVEAAVVSFNGTPGDPASFDRLHELLELQPYRLASWRTAADEINYRRFFDINELAGLRVEDPAVFEDIHSLLLALVRRGVAAGVRLDHIDGLSDPQEYLGRLAAAAATDANGAPRDGDPLYVVAEKILTSGEALRTSWPVAGTTGYTFLNDVNGVFVDGRQGKRLQRLYARVTGRQVAFADVAYESKRLIVSTALSSEFQVLTQAVNRLSERERRARDFTLASIRRALREVVACFPVYRTYVDAGGFGDGDATVVDAAIADARRRNPAMESSIFDFLRTVLLPENPADGAEPAPDHERDGRIAIAMRFQQYSAPVQAKGVEDTAFYRYHVLTSLDEVGGDPRRIGRTVAELHAANAERRRLWPGEMLATTTHDTKRSEDARARINVLSELPDAWQAAVGRWRRLNQRNRTALPGGRGPDANDEYLFYQALVGAWPAESGDGVPTAAPGEFVARLAAYMDKAIKEAKLHTSWITPNVEYEAAVARFVERSLAGPTAPDFFASFVPFARRVARGGMVNALAQLVIKIAAPGVADFYQGVELWDQSLVDPDNRRAVDWDRRRAWMAELEAPLSGTTLAGPGQPGLASAVASLVEAWPDGRLKLFVTAVGLRARRERPDVFLAGDYLALDAAGAHPEQVVAFERQSGADRLVALAPRLTTRLTGGTRLPLGHETWQDTAVPWPTAMDGRVLRDLITGRRIEPADTPSGPAIRLADALHVCPVALLWSEPA